MALSKLKATARIQAVRKFTDRERPRDVFEDAFSAHLRRDLRLRVLMYYGVGGIGKSALLDHLRARATSYRDGNQLAGRLDIIHVSLDALRFDSAADCLLAIHSQLTIPCPLFEYALAAHWLRSGLTPQDFKRRKLREDSLVLDLVEAGGELADEVVPAKLLKKLWDLIAEKYRHTFGRYKEHLQKIDACSDTELAVRLPLYLGLAIDEASRSDERSLVVFIDGHDKLQSKASHASTDSTADWWLRELIGAAEFGLWVIAGREYLKWADRNQEWNDYLDQHALGSLSDTDAEYFLTSIPITDVAVRVAIIRTARGVPLYLDLCASMYVIAASEGGTALREEDFDLAEGEVVSRFLDHLDREQAEALKAMSVLELFDIDMFLAIMSALNIAFPITLFEEFCNTSYSVCVDQHLGLYKIHDIVRSYVGRTVDPRNTQRIVSAALHSLTEHLNHDDADRISKHLSQLTAAITTMRRPLPLIDEESWLTIALWLVDAGRWRSVHAALPTRPAPNDGTQHLPSFSLAEAVCWRRRGQLMTAKLLLDGMRGDVTRLGHNQGEYWFHIAHVNHLLGDYDQAEKSYGILARETDGARFTNSARVRAKRQLADVLFLKGRFLEASRHLDELLSSDSPNELWHYESARIKGHVLRFNLLWEPAIEIYRVVLEAAERLGAIGLIGKALTNLAEATSCFAPLEAIRYADLAIEANREVDSPIEIGKALAAKAAALVVGQVDLDQAMRLIIESARIQSDCGYRAGLVFSMMSDTLVGIAKNDRDHVARVLFEIQALTSALGVYKFVSLLPLLFLGNEAEVQHSQSGHQWLAVETTMRAAKGVISATGR